MEEILVDLIARGETIQQNVKSPEAAQLFLEWLPDVKTLVEETITDSALKYEAKKLLQKDLKKTTEVGGMELAPKLSRVLQSLGILRVFADERKRQQNSENVLSIPSPMKIGRTGSRIATAFEEYVIDKQIGQGGAGSVFSAKASDGSNVAIKILHPNLSQEKIKRFKNEISFCQKNSHAGIIRIVDYGLLQDVNESQPFYVMPLYDGTLRKYLNTHPKFTPLVIAIGQILDAIEAAHLRDCIHRDLKPENILFSLSKRQFVITDFGIAHFSEDDLVTIVETKHESRLANFQYAAPEQRQKGQKIDHRADIYALGLIINESFTGQVPHGTGFKKIREVSPEHQYLDDVVEKMIHQRPESRYQTIKEVKEDLFRKGKVEVSFQKINSIKKTVVQDNDISTDPLIADPIRVIDIDHNGRFLVCTLNQHVTVEWQHAFQACSHTWSSMHHPSNCSFRGNLLNVETPIEDAVDAKNFVDEWLRGANQVYKAQRAAAASARIEEQKRILEIEAEFEQKRRDFLSKVKL